MILDNRQVVPDIIVSREGVPNPGLLNVNINNNNNNQHQVVHYNQGGDRLGSVDGSPRHFSKGVSKEVSVINPYVSGNNNGSPRHVPHNGNYYSDAKGIYPADHVVQKRILTGSPIHSSVRTGSQGSPRHLQQPVVTFQNGRPPPRSPVLVQSKFDSPIHHKHSFQKSQECFPFENFRENLVNSPKRFETGFRNTESPKKLPSNLGNVKTGTSSPKRQVRTHTSKPNLTNVYYSPKLSHNKRIGADVQCPNQLTGEIPAALPRSPRHSSFLTTFRPRSSSIPCEGEVQPPQIHSKIPIQISKLNKRITTDDLRKKKPEGEENVQHESPRRNLNKTYQEVCALMSRKNSISAQTQRGELSRTNEICPKRVGAASNAEIIAHANGPYSTPTKKLNQNLVAKRDSFELNRLSGDSPLSSMDRITWTTEDSSSSWNIDSDKSEEENDQVYLDGKVSPPLTTRHVSRGRTTRLVSWPSAGNLRESSSDREDFHFDSNLDDLDGGTLSDKDSGVESEGTLSSKMVLIKCKDANYLTRLFVNPEGVHGLRVVGRVGVGGSAQGHVMSLDQPQPAHGDLYSNHSTCSDDVIKGNDITGRDVLSENTTSFISQATDAEFEHEAADYQWLLDYEYRESYSKDSLGAGRDAVSRVSVLRHSHDGEDFSYETFSRNIDANLAEIDMDDFRSEDINQLLVMPNIPAGDFQNQSDELYCSVSGSLLSSTGLHRSCSGQSERCHHHQQQLRLHHQLLLQQQQQQQQQQQLLLQQQQDDGEEDDDVVEFIDEGDHQHCYGDDEREEELSGVSGDVSSLYQSGPLFSPLKEPPHMPPSFSVDSLDSDSIHEDLILTCQANKDNYTIAFEGSFVQYSEDSDYQEPGDSSGTWSTERLEGRSPAPNMTHSDQPYTTWSRVSRRSSQTSSQSRTPDPSLIQNCSRQSVNSPLPTVEKAPHSYREPQESQSSKSNSMPNLMRRSLMKHSLENTGQCVKVFDLQNSLRSSQLSSARSIDANNFSLMRLFIKQKSLSKEAVSMSSSFTDPSQEGACSSSENQSGVNDSSDWPMNSQSENDMDGSASSVPAQANNAHLIIDRGYRRRGNTTNILSGNSDYSTTVGDPIKTTHTNNLTEAILNNNNIPPSILDTVNSNPLDNVTSFEDSLKEPNPCSKPPMTSPIREEPEGMDISVDSKGEKKAILDQSEKETIGYPVLRLKEAKTEQNNIASLKARSKDVSNKNIQENNNSFNAKEEILQRSRSPATPKHEIKKKETISNAQRRRQDSGYVSHKGSTEKIRRSSDSDKIMNLLEKPKPKPRSLKQVTDQCLQTSNLKVSATVNTSGFLEKKEVYVYYPNYALPDLGFLKEKKYSVDARIFLVPQHYAIQPQDMKLLRDKRTNRPFSCGDMEKLRKQGFSHIKDWDSLNFLLPKELKEMLLDETDCMETTKPSFCNPSKNSRRPVSCDYQSPKLSEDYVAGKGSSTSLNSTQPSSGYRGSSTLLNDSEDESDLRYAYRYDTRSADSDSFDRGPPLPKRSVSLAGEERHPPVSNCSNHDIPPPRPPLPRGILRKCTSLKDEPNKKGVAKRHSAGDSSKRSMREDLLKRRSLQEPMDSSDESKESKEKYEDMDCSCINECTGFCAKGLRRKNLLLVNELPEVSSHEEMTEEDLARLRCQVSEFLVNKGSQVESIFGIENSHSACDCPRKSVSFAEKDCNHKLQATINQSIGKTSSGVVESSVTKKLLIDAPVKSRGGEAFCLSTQRGRSLTSDEDLPSVLYDAHDKKTLVLSVRAAVEKMVRHFNRGTTQQEKNKLGNSMQTPEVAQIAIDKLCPAIYALLSDGLLPSLHSLFGKISNSVWRVVEATSQMGSSTKALNDLVLTLNSEECLSEGPIKFNAFIFGLLNIRSLDAWLSYLRTRESSLQKHYHPESFLYLSNTAMRGLYDDLLAALRPLVLLPFRLDLLHEYKALHASLLKMEERLALHSSMSPVDAPSKGLDLMLVAKESKEFRNAAARTTERSRSPRPRSCHENTGIDIVPSALKKRWSGVQLGSRFVTAIDRLMTEEGEGSSSGDYTDSIDNPHKPLTLNDKAFDDALTDMRLSDLSSKDGDLSERSATDKDTDTEKGIQFCNRGNESEGEKFRRLQLKWEAMTIHGKPANGTQATGTKSRDDDHPDPRDKSISPAGVQRSRIPRPVSITSPLQNFKPFEPAKDKISPQLKHNKKTLPSTISKELPKAAPRKSLKDHILPTDHNEASRGPSVRSRVGFRAATTAALPTMSAAMSRASSVPGRKLERGNSGSRLVQTLHHRLATDNGHLSFSRGDILTVIVEVDERFILCCLHDRKGLVPRTSVVTIQ